MATTGKLILIPNVIAENTQASVIPESVRDALKPLRFFLAEEVRTARRYFSSLKIFDSIESLHFEVLNKDTQERDVPLLLNPLMEGHDMGLVSDAGCPGVADPGALAVKYAHEKGIRVVPLVGPSSILLALMSSGMNGQRFAFHGYLPVESKSAAQAIIDLERESRAKQQTQLLIETPYRNNQVLHHLIAQLHPETMLCVAIDITSTEEKIISKKIRDWKRQSVELPKAPAIFLFLAG